MEPIFHKSWVDPETGKRKYHVYLDPETNRPLNGVTSVLAIIAKNLTPWAGRVDASMAFQKASNMNPQILELLATELAKYPNISKDDAERIGGEYPEYDEARTAHDGVKDRAAEKGTDTHQEVENYVLEMIEKNVGNAKEIETKHQALRSFIQWAIQNNVRFIASEKKLMSREWALAGTADLIFEQDGKRYVGDVKTYAKLWDNVAFFQAAAYAKMSQESGEHFDGTCIINIPKDTNQVQTFYRYDLEGDTKSFEAALRLFRTV